VGDGDGVARIGQRPVRYRPRPVRSRGWSEDVPGWLVKWYAISALREVPPPEVHEFAQRAALATLPEPYPGALCCAFSVVHEDEDGCYVVIGWWSPNRLILHTKTWLADWPDLTPAPAPADATACIWEMVAIAHERDAWVRHVVIPPVPELDAYLADTVSGEF
jgi:hypothetical protein